MGNVLLMGIFLFEYGKASNKLIMKSESPIPACPRARGQFLVL